jgi:hypothetical protein
VTEIHERFKRDTAEHCMVVLHDDGLYRHLSFRRPTQSWAYWFELITVPGALIFRGDGESFVFARMDDMFEFFRMSAYRGEPNPSYWAEKLTDGAQRAMTYSEDRFREWVAETVASRDDLPGLDAAVERDIFQEWDISFEVNARQALDEFKYFVDEINRWALTTPDFAFDASEAVFDDYYWWYLWACHAIVWGIAQYDRAKAAKADVAKEDRREIAADSLAERTADAADRGE